MKEAYRIAVKRPRRRYRAYFLLVAGALCLYLASFSLKDDGMRVESARGVLVTREETLPAQQFFIVSLFDSADETAAQVESARYAPRGASGAVMKIGGLYHAAGAAFLDHEEAGRAAQELAGEIDASVACALAPEAVLRVTATQQQLGALLQADAALISAADEFGNIAARIDSGNIDLQGAQGLLYAQAGRLRAALEEMEICPDSEEISAAIKGQLSLAYELALRLCEAREASRLSFSSSVRCLQAELIGSFCAYRSALTK